MLDIKKFPKKKFPKKEIILLAQMAEDDSNLINWIEFSNTLTGEQKLEVHNKRIELSRKIEKDKFESMTSEEKKAENEKLNKSINTNHFTGNMGELKGEHGNDENGKSLENGRDIMKGEL